VNRASWSLGSLAEAYKNEYGTSVSKSTISDFFKNSGYKFKKAKKVLTSSDPEFRTKLAIIKQTLAKLEPEEKFFSIDEFGPFSIKMRGGRALVSGDIIRTIPQRQKSKGSLICTWRNSDGRRERSAARWVSADLPRSFERHGSITRSACSA
jgi:hypothetical protein